MFEFKPPSNLWDYNESIMRANEEAFGLSPDDRPLYDMNIRYYPQYLLPLLTTLECKEGPDSFNRPLPLPGIFISLSYHLTLEGVVSVYKPILPKMLLMSGCDESMFIRGLRVLLEKDMIRAQSRRINQYTGRTIITYAMNPFLVTKGSWSNTFVRRLWWGGMDTINDCMRQQEEEEIGGSFDDLDWEQNSD